MKNVSIGFYHFFVRRTFLTAPILVLMLMKKAPMSPPPTPRQMDAGIRTRVGMNNYPLIEPNFKDEEFWVLRSHEKIAGKRDSQKLAREHERNTFQIILNLQKVFGLDIS